MTEHLARHFSEIPRSEKNSETSSRSTSRCLGGSSSRDLGQKKPLLYGVL